MLFSIFKTDSATKQAQKEKEEEGRETAKACAPHFRQGLAYKQDCRAN